MALLAVCLAFTSCDDEKIPEPPLAYYQMETVLPNTAVVCWNPADYDFEKGNSDYLKVYEDMENALKAMPACSSWRNGRYHGRNLDWYQANYGCLVIRMPKSDKVRHASVSVLNGNSKVTQQFISEGIISEEMRVSLPCVVVDGINDAGVSVNINIVPHQPGTSYIGQEGDLSSQCVVRYVLDNAGSVRETVDLLSRRKVRQSIVGFTMDETHYMISDKDQTAVVEFDNGQMVVTYYKEQDGGFLSENGNEAIMTNLYNFQVERYGLATDAFYENHPYAMGVERWNTIKEQYAKASGSVQDNLDIASSVWYFKNLMADRLCWYTENAIPTVFGKDGNGWYYIASSQRVNCESHDAAMAGFWNYFMEKYWDYYDGSYGQMQDPHVKGNDFWETSHTVIYDLEKRTGYLVPFENFYAPDKVRIDPVVITLP